MNVVCSATQILLSLLIQSAFSKRHVPPEPIYSGYFRNAETMDVVAERVSTWTPKDKENVWELSGHYEGDIMLTEEEDWRNALSDETIRWKNGIIPYYVEKDHFSEYNIKVIQAAIKEYHSKTCIRFRPFKKGDEDYIIFRGNRSGCWSYVGKKGGGQVINLQKSGCVYHGIVIHEVLHALGFYHQQSSPERDEYVEIKWENIREGKEYNFKKHSNSQVTNYGVEYDYGSVMHYSEYAFSANGEPTIVPLDETADIGQRTGLSDKDVKKLAYMYECMEDDSEEMLWFLEASKKNNNNNNN